MEASDDRLEVATRGEDAFVRVVGRGSFKAGPALKKFGVLAVDGGCRRVILDMQSCVGMDSTFMGVLAGLVMLLKKQSGEMVMTNLSKKNRFLLETLGLGGLIRMEPAEGDEEKSKTDLTPLDTAVAWRETAEVMVAAHETLVTISPDNLSKFKDVLACLKEGLKRKDTAAGPTH